MAGENSNQMRNSQSNNTSRNTRRAQTDGVDLKQTLVSLNSSVDNLSKSLSSQEKALKDLGVILNKQQKKEGDLLDEEKKARKEHLARSKKIADSVVNTVWSVAKQVMGFFTNSMRQIQSSYNTNFSEITSKLDITASQYTQAYRDVAADLRNTKLNLQFDSTDFMESLKDNLAQGLRGDQAQRKAMSDLISKKLVPSINTNTRSYIQSYKLLGDDFSKYSIGIARLNQTMGKSMEYYEQGLYTTTQEQFGNLLYGLGLGSSDIAQFHDVFAQLTSQYGSEYANEIISTINAGLSGVVNTPLAIAGYGTAEKLASAIQSGRFEDIVGQLISTQNRLVSGQNLTTANVMSQAGILGTSSANALYASRLGEFDYTQYTDEEIRAQTEKDNLKLQQGYYQSVTKKMEKYNNNLEGVVNASTWLAEHIPDQIQQLGHTIESGVLDIIHAITGTTFKQLLSGGLSNLLSTRILRTPTETPVNTGSWLFESGGATSAGAVGASIASIVAGLAIRGVQGAITNKEIEAEGGDASGWRGVANVGRSLLGISNYSQRGIDYKRANYEIDLGETLLAAGTGAAIGGGVGTLVPIPGVSTAVGAVAGALIGGATNLFSQLEKKSEYKRYMDSLTSFAESVDISREAINNFTKSSEALLNTEEIYNTLKEEGNNLQSLTNGDLETLKDAYPGYFDGLSDISQLTGIYVKILEQLNEEAQQNLINEANKSYKESIGNIQIGKGVVGGAISTELLKRLKEAGQSGGSIDLTKIATDFGFSSGESLKSFLNASNGVGEIIAGGPGDYHLATGFFNDRGIDKISFNEEELRRTYLDQIERWNGMAEIIENAMLDPETAEEKKVSLERALRDIHNNFAGIGKNEDFEELRRSPSRTTTAIEAFNKLIKSPLKFKTGIRYVPEDDYPALLHRGERVLTSFESTSLDVMQVATLSIRESVDMIVVILGDILESVKGLSVGSSKAPSTSYNPSLVDLSGGAYRF